MLEKTEKFPKGFLWGSATSSYQVEGGIYGCDWAKAAIDDQKLRQMGRRPVPPFVPAAGRAVDHYHLYEKDFDMAVSLGQNAHRFSLEWSRIEPEEGKFDEREIEHYRSILRALKKRNLEPFVTLWHFTLPIWFVEQGGFENKNSARIFARYCSYVISKLGSEASYWMTINEPVVWATDGYMWGKWPPFKRNIFLYQRVIGNLVKAHILAYQEMKHINSKIQIGIAKNNIHFESNWNPFNFLLSKFLTWFKNFRFLNAIYKHQDFIGLNYYIHKKFGGNEQLPKSDMGWEIYPEGLYHCLLQLKKYNKPVYITENGIADALDTKRAQFIKDSIDAVKKAIDDGIDVKGYFYWSLLDNFEWSYGFEKRFGLIEVNYDTMVRKIRSSAYVYRDVIGHY